MALIRTALALPSRCVIGSGVTETGSSWLPKRAWQALRGEVDCEHGGLASVELANHRSPRGEGTLDGTMRRPSASQSEDKQEEKRQYPLYERKGIGEPIDGLFSMPILCLGFSCDVARSASSLVTGCGNLTTCAYDRTVRA